MSIKHEERIFSGLMSGNMSRLFVLMGAILLSGCASSPIEISESDLNREIGKSYPKHVAGFRIHSPKINLEQGYVHYCAEIGLATIPGSGFCVRFSPDWKSNTKSIHAKDLRLTKIQVDEKWRGSRELIENLINTHVMPALEGAKIYEIDGFAARKFSSIEVAPGKLVLKF